MFMSCLHRIGGENYASRRAVPRGSLNAQKSQEAFPVAVCRSLPLVARLAITASMALAISSIAAPPQPQLTFTTLDFGTSGTFLTGIRGNNIVGNYRDPGQPDRRTALQPFDRGLDAVSGRDDKRRQLPRSNRILALRPRLWLAVRHSERRRQLQDPPRRPMT